MRTSSAPHVFVLCLLQFLDVMGATMVITLLPTMVAETDAGPAGATALSTGYAVAFGGCLILGARLGDRFGHVRVIVASTVVFAAAGALVAAAPTLVLLSTGRVLQGLAAAVTVPAALFLITLTTNEGRPRQRAIAAWSAAGAAAGAAGFIVGGIASASGHWRISFLILGILAGGLGLLTRRLFRRAPARSAAGALDAGGGLLLTLTVGLVVAGTALVRDQPATGLGLGIAALLSGSCLAAVERKSTSPILSVDVLRSPAVRRGSAVSFINTATTSAAAAMVTLSLQDEYGRSGLATAVVLLPFSIAVMAGSACAPRLMDRNGGNAAMACGLAGIGTGTALLALVPGQLTGIGAAMAVSGAGIGLSSSAATHTGTEVSENIRSAAAATLNTAAQLGTALGIAAALAVAVQWGFGAAWLLLAGAAMAAAAVVARLKAGTAVL